MDKGSFLDSGPDSLVDFIDWLGPVLKGFVLDIFWGSFLGPLYTPFVLEAPF